MEETVGTLNLKIARLEQKLQILQKQRLLSKPYPDHLAHLLLQEFQTRALLQNLLEHRARKQNSVSHETLLGDCKSPVSRICACVPREQAVIY